MARLLEGWIENRLIVNAVGDLSSYGDPATTLSLRDGRTFRYNSASSATIDNIFTCGATAKGGGRWEAITANDLDFSLWLSPDLTGTTDCSAALAKACTQGGRIYLTGTLRVNTGNIALISGTTIYGNATLVLSNGVVNLFTATDVSNVELNGITVVRASGATNTPAIMLIRRCNGIRVKDTTTIGVHGLQTFRPEYDQTDENELCHDITVSGNKILNTGEGQYGGGIVLNYCADFTVTNNTVDGALHGIFWWGGDANPDNGENADAGGQQNVATKWVRNGVISGNTVRNITFNPLNGGGIWGSMGENIKVTSNTVQTCGDVGIDFESCRNCIASDNIVSNCRNAALALFYGTEQVSFLNNYVTQSAAHGKGLYAFGIRTHKDVHLSGGFIKTLGAGKEALFTEGVVDGLTVDGGIILDSVYRAIFLQLSSRVVITKATIRSQVLNVDVVGGTSQRPYAAYIQGGNDIEISDNTFQYTGVNGQSVGPIFLSDGVTGNLNRVRLSNNLAPTGFPLGVKTDQFAGGTGNRYYDNVFTGFTSVNGSQVLFNNRNAAGEYIDATHTEFLMSSMLSMVTSSTGGYVPILTLPATTEGTYDTAVLHITLGLWAASAKKTYILTLGQRDGFFLQTICMGDSGAAGSLKVYQKTDGSSVLYALLGGFYALSVNFASLQQVTPVVGLAITSVSAPSGTLIYDSATTAPNLEVQPTGIKQNGVAIIKTKPNMAPTNGQVLAWNAANSYWENVSPS